MSVKYAENMVVEGNEFMNEDERLQCDKLWQQYEPLVKKMCTLKLQSIPDEIDDVVSEIFLALCNKVDKSGLPENPKTWLYGVTKNLIKKKYKKSYRERQTIVSLTDFEETTTDDWDFVKEIEDRNILYQLMDIYDGKLKEKEKALLKYIYIDHLKMKEIAEIFHTNEQAVKQKYYRLRKRMYKIAKKFTQTK